MPYRNPVLTRRFDELVEDGDTCHVIIRNPKTMPGTAVAAMAEGDAGEDGNTAGGGAKMERIYGIIASLVIGWRVWDPTVPIKADPETGELIHDEETEPRLLPLPATAENVAKLPQPILMDLMRQVTDAISPNQPQAETTGSPS